MLSNRIQTIETKEFTLVTLTQTFESKTPKKVLAFDVDDTMLDWSLSVERQDTVLKKEQELRKALDSAKKNGYELVIVTARPYDKMDQLEKYPHLTIDAILQKLGKDYFSGIYFANPKYPALVDLSQRFQTKDVSLVDDLESNRSLDFGFFQINDSDVYTSIQQHISPKTKEEKASNTKRFFELLEKEDYQAAIILFETTPYLEIVDRFKKIFSEKLLKHIQQNQGESLDYLLAICPESILSYFLQDMKSSPLLAAVTAENFEVMKKLIALGATDYSPLFYEKTISFVKNLVKINDYKKVEEIIQQFPDLPEESLPKGKKIAEYETLVQWAVDQGKPELIRIIGKYNKGAINQTFPKGSALHDAITFSEIACLKALIEAKANLNLVNHENETPLQHAFTIEHTEAIKELLDAGAEAFPKDHKSSDCIFPSNKYSDVTLSLLEEFIEKSWPEEEKRPSLAKKHLTLIQESDLSTHAQLKNIDDSAKKMRSALSSSAFFSDSSGKLDSLKEYLNLFLSPLHTLDRLIEARSKLHKPKVTSELLFAK